MLSPYHLVLAISVALFSPFFLSHHSVACQSPAPPEAFELLRDTQSKDVITDLLAERMENYNASENPNSSDEDKILAIKKTLDIDRRIMEGLNNGGETFRGTMSEQELEAVGKQIHLASASSALSLSKLLERTQDYDELAKVVDYFATEIRTAHGESHWRMAEATALLKQARWLAAAGPIEQTKWAAARKDFNEANELLRNRQWQAGLPKMMNAKSSLEAIGATDHFFYGEAVANLAEAQFGIGDLKSAEEMFQLAIETNEKVFGQPTPTMANMRVSFSRVYRALNDTVEELALLEAAETIAREVHGTPSIELSQVHLLEGDVYLRTKQFELAKERIKSSLLLSNLQNVSKVKTRCSTSLRFRTSRSFSSLASSMRSQKRRLPRLCRGSKRIWAKAMSNLDASSVIVL